MKLTSRGRYAVMALADIAAFDRKNPISLRDISLRQNISLLYLEQIFFKLKKNNIVKSIRGTNGGYILTKNPDQIKIATIFTAVDEKIKTMGCKRDSKKSCNGKTTKCITHSLWDDLEMHINDFFDKKNLGDLVKNNLETRI
jgi:Rrf2 family iron-sulfur cluster assembly transcriptional regulator